MGYTAEYSVCFHTYIKVSQKVSFLAGTDLKSHKSQAKSQSLTFADF